MHSLAFLATLLIPLAAAAPEVAASPSPEADDAIIFDSVNYGGQKRLIPVNGICQNLGPPFTDRGIRSIQLEGSGRHCNIHFKTKCNGPAYTVYESENFVNIKAFSIRCVQNPN